MKSRRKSALLPKFCLRLCLPVMCLLAPFAASAEAPDLKSAPPSFLFGRDPQEAFGRAADESSPRFNQALRRFEDAGYRELLNTWGAQEGQQTVILIKDDELESDFTHRFLSHIALEKGNLMKLYGLSNRDFNRLAAMSFGILGRESKFATSKRYFLKKNTPEVVMTAFKLDAALDRAAKEVVWSILNGTKPNLNMSISSPSSGPTQIKKVPWKVRQNYCINEEDLDSARESAIATMGFLAESLKETRQRVRNRQITTIDENNIFDYVLYVYTGRIRQALKDPSKVSFNPYIRAVKAYMKALVVLERNTPAPLRTIDSQCMISELPK